MSERHLNINTANHPMHSKNLVPYVTHRANLVIMADMLPPNQAAIKKFPSQYILSTDAIMFTL